MEGRLREQNTKLEVCTVGKVDAIKLNSLPPDI